MVKDKTLILDTVLTAQKIRRIAYEVLENNLKEKEIVLAGIWEKGYQLAKALKKELDEVANIQITLVKVNLDKQLPTQSEIELDCELKSLKNKTIILLDDVLNTGRTMAYSLKPFLNIRVKKIETVVLVNRSHPTFPISATYTGYELSTTINEHVDVQVDKSGMSVFLA